MKSGRGDAKALAAGGPARHIPVLRDEVVEALGVRPDGLYVDATFGAGGYSTAILATAGTRVLALDRDPTAILGAADIIAAAGDRLRVVERRFGDMGKVAAELGVAAVDGIVFDIGVSSMQIDTAERGFSFRVDGPLDMRMSGTGTTAAEILAQASDAELADIFYYYGEERGARRIARAIVADRTATPFVSTAQLAGLVSRLMPGRPGDIHPATRTFQALRIAVNDELGELYRALIAAEDLLAADGRLVVVSFHSLEDRIVKTFLAQRSGRGQARSRVLPGEPEPELPTFTVPRGQPIVASAAETAANPRARSAKLRYAIRTPAPARGGDASLRRLAELPGRGA